MGTSMKTLPKLSRGRRSSRDLMRIYDRQNDTVSEIILADPEKHTRFQIDWAQREDR